MVDDVGFTNLLKTLDARALVPSRTHIATKLIPDLYRVTKDQIAVELRSCTRISLTTDSWTSCATNNYTTFTAHFVSEDWLLKSYVLAMRKSPSHTSEAIKHEIEVVMDDWGINVSAITSDNATIITKAISEAGYINIRCLAHTINLATNRGLAVRAVDNVIVKIRRIVSYFHRSPKVVAVLQAKQQLMNTPTRRLIIDVSTR